jgi:hypothetical protein
VSETSSELRDGVREAMLGALRQDVDRTGGRTARRLLAVGATGVLGALGATLLLSGHPYAHHPSWHAVFAAAIWAGLLVVSLTFVALQVRTPSLPIGQAAMVAVLGLGIAGICSAASPDGHFLQWWNHTRLGSHVAAQGGPATSALCFGFVTTLIFAAVASALALRDWSGIARSAVLPAAMLFALLVPGIALQSVDTPSGVFVAWIAAGALGSYAGVAAGASVRARAGAGAGSRQNDDPEQ